LLHPRVSKTDFFFLVLKILIDSMRASWKVLLSFPLWWLHDSKMLQIAKHGVAVVSKIAAQSCF
jgi:hypothetical protein